MFARIAPVETSGLFEDRMKEYTNSRISFLIDEYIHNKRDREIMKLHYIDGLSADVIANMKGIDLTPRRVSQILSDRLLEIDRYL